MVVMVKVGNLCCKCH